MEAFQTTMLRMTAIITIVKSFSFVNCRLLAPAVFGNFIYFFCVIFSVWGF